MAASYKQIIELQAKTAKAARDIDRFVREAEEKISGLELVLEGKTAKGAARRRPLSAEERKRTEKQILAEKVLIGLRQEAADVQELGNKIATAALNNQLKINAATERQKNLIKALKRSGVSGQRAEEVEELKKVAAANRKNVGILNSTNNALLKILETQREITRSDVAQDRIARKNAKGKQFDTRIKQLEAVGASQDALKQIEKERFKLADLNVTKQTDLAKRQLAIVEELIQAQEKLNKAYLQPTRQIASPIKGAVGMVGSPKDLERTEAAALRLIQLSRRADQLAGKIQNKIPQQLALPSTEILKPQKKGIQILDSEVRGRTERIQQRLERNAQRNKQLAEETLEINKARLKAMDNIVKTKRKEGRATVRLAQQEQKLRKETQKRKAFTQTPLGRAAVGAAFPALFGAGPGGIIGGGLGELLGPLGGVVGSAIGGFIDEAAKRITDIGNAIRTLDLSALEQASVRISKELKLQIELLKEQGRLGRARQLVESAIVAQSGASSTALKDVSNSGNLLKAAFDELVLTSSTFLGIVGAPLAAALAGVLKIVSEIFKLVNRGLSFIGGVLREIEKIIDPAGVIAANIEKLAPALAESSIEAAKLNRELEKSNQLILSNLRFDLESAQLKKVNATAEDQIAQVRRKALEDRRKFDQQAIKDTEKLKGLSLEQFTARAREISERKLIQQTIVDTNAAFEIANIKMRERNRLAREGLNIAKERQRFVQQQLSDARALNAAIIQANTAEKVFLNTILSDPTPFSEVAAERRRENELTLIQIKLNERLVLIRNSGAKQEIQIEQERAANAKADLDRLKVNNRFIDEARQKEENRLKSVESISNRLDQENALLKAKLNGNTREVSIQQQLLSFATQIQDIRTDELNSLEEKLRITQELKDLEETFNIQQRTGIAGAGLRAGFIGQAGQAFEQQLQQGSTAERATEIALLTQEMELAELQAQSLQNAVLGIGDAFATAMTTGVAGLIDGTKNAEEVFSDFLKGVGNALLQSAQQMIATYIAIGIARAFAGFGKAPDAGDAMSGTGFLPQITKYDTMGPVPGQLANGGPAKAGQPYMVGERGPELFVPSSNGGVMRNEDMRQLMGRSPVGNAPAMNFTFETTNIGGTEYVSREQLEAAMATTRRQAANDGAKRGMNMTLDRMQNSPRTRARVGIS